jgi:hypothetical protein
MLHLMILLLGSGAAAEQRFTCGNGYGWNGNSFACPDPLWEPNWQLNLSTAISNTYSTPEKAAAWGLVTFGWDINADWWQNVHPHPGEEAMAKQCRGVKAQGTGSRCMVYRQNELSLQWQETSRSAQTDENADMYLHFKSKELCDAAAPCDVAAFHQTSQQLIACNRTAPVSAPNCAYCCNFSSVGNGVYNEPIGGQYPSGLKPAHGDNALGDGQLFFDFRNNKTVDFWVKHVALGAVMNDNVDGLFADDPAGYGQEHLQIQSAVQLDATEIQQLQEGTQRAYNNALAMFLPLKKYFWNGFRSVDGWPSANDAAACSSWMRSQCTRPTNESAVMYSMVSSTDMAAAKVSIAAFLVTRGAHSYIYERG